MHFTEPPLTDTSIRSIVHLHAMDNIGVAIRPVPTQTELTPLGVSIRTKRYIPLGHKLAITSIAVGEPIRKYGQIIGFASEPIEAGDWVHCHNIVVGDFVREYAPATETPPPPQPITDRTFMGYRRANGKAGTRNYVAVISTVNCSASVSKYIARHFTPERLADYPNVDGVIGLTHHGGCSMQYGGLAHQMLTRVLGGMAKHPNIGAYVLIGLGCEQGAMGYLLEQQQLVQLSANGERKMPPVFSMQDMGGTRKTVEAGIRTVIDLLPLANKARREPIPASEIVLATECGGSDGNSGITANPALGLAADRIVACGGTAILSETSEIYGAEHLLTRRATSVAVAQKLIERIEWWKWYTGIFDVVLDNNPSVGNKEGGLTTIVEKSLGAVAKGGSTALVDVYQYAEEVVAKGFVVMDTPGYDPPSVTGMVAGGANVVAFTTGRGSCFGCKPTPSIKIATNTPMYERMQDDMDVNAGEVLDGLSLEEMGTRIFEKILAVASGGQTKSEQHGIGEEEFIPWIVGPTL